ncbi:MAG: hypothetical protein KKA07_03105 [Bacteroidetes bacterium]|nr:hypothetical protein [Bacteroidota bacterium]MBU1718039.1 hypothetical protein [Bacteroidota bacterium]
MRKIIFSRKGIDSKYGGGNSPILPDGELLSIPIPIGRRENESGISYKDNEAYNGISFHELIAQLGIKPQNDKCHLDPDLRASILQRKEGWRPIFGQSGRAATHLLSTEKVKEGDIFLFYGNFREVFFNEESRTFQYTQQHPRHIIFGYLIIDEIWDLGNNPFPEYKKSIKEIPEWAKSHPHLSYRHEGNNCLFVAREKYRKGIPGAGGFFYNDKLALTKLGYNKRIWELEDIFASNNMRISYHENPDRYLPYNRNGKVLLQAVDQGQEFVVTPTTTKAEADLFKWVDNLICNSKRFE